MIGGPSAEVRAGMKEKFFTVALEGKLASLGTGNMDLESVLLVLSGNRHVVLDIANCNLEAIDSLKEGDMVTLELVDPEHSLSIGGGWTIAGVKGPNGNTLYLSPGYKGDRNLFEPNHYGKINLHQN